MGERKPRHRILKGMGVSPGVAYGRVCVYGDIHTVPRYTIRTEEVKDGLARLRPLVVTQFKQDNESSKRRRDNGRPFNEVFGANLEESHYSGQFWINRFGCWY